MEGKWWKEAVIYQIYPRSFMDSNGDGIGDLKGIISKIDYLVELGVSCVWLCPVYKSPNCDNGYDISDYRDIMDDFGTLEIWEELLHELHKHNIRLVMDLVVNHSSDENQWFVESRSSLDNPKRDYYIWRSAKPDGSLPNNWMACFGGPAWEYDKTTDQYYLHLFAIKQPDLNWESQHLREEIQSMMKFWLDKGIDGFRMDAISYISKVAGLPDGKGKGEPGTGFEHYAQGPHIHEYLHELNTKVLSNYDCMTVGEVSYVDLKDGIDFSGPDRQEINMIYMYDLLGMDKGEKRWQIRDWKLPEFKSIICKWQKGLSGKGWNSLYISNHDIPRAVSRYGNDSPEYRIVSAKMLATMNHTLQGTPYIYQGEEIGMTNVKFDSIDDYDDIEIRNFYYENEETHERTREDIMASIHHFGRDNSRTPMQWDSSPNAGFTTGKPWIKINPNYQSINVAESLSDPNSVFHYYQKLIKMRKELPILIDGHFDSYYEDDLNLFVYTRTLENQVLFIALNFSNSTQNLAIPSNLSLEGSKLVISNYENDESSIPKQLRPYEAIVYLKN